MEKIINGLDGKYTISSDGVVYSTKGRKKELKGAVRKSGYRDVLINHLGNRRYFLVHRLVAEYFVENPRGKRTVNHKNGIKTDNRASNLEWMTDSENQLHARDNGLLNTKITMDIAEEIRKDKGTHRQLALKYNLSRSFIGQIKKGDRWASA